MEHRYILHFLTPARHASPFDVNMALDAGFDSVMPYTQVTIDDVAPLTQDAIFSRGPNGVRRTGIFIGGREVELAHEMLETAQAAMVPPFEASVFADPSGAYTTAAAMVAEVERLLRASNRAGLQGLNVVVYGIGPVGVCSAVLAAMIRGRSASDSEQKRSMLGDCHVLLSCGKAGVRLFSRDELAAARELLVAADVNAVPPEGIEGVGAMDRGKPLVAGSGRALGIGALAIGNVKFKVQRALFEKMRSSDRPVFLDFRDAFELARELSPDSGH